MLVQLTKKTERDLSRFQVRFGQAVRDARKASGLSMAELGSRTGMAAPNISRIEHGDYIPSLRTIFIMKHVLGIQVEDLFQ